MRIHRFKKFDEFVKISTKFISNSCIKHAKIALSGGSTPKPVYESLAKEPLEFNKIDFYQVDERYVPKDHKKSNYRMIFETLINKVDTNFHYFNTKLTIKDSLAKYEKDLPKSPFNLTILGIGPDGHIASLFPNSKIPDETRAVAHTQTEIFDIKDRLTLTFPRILTSKKLLVLLNGPEKQHIIDELQNPTLSDKKFPAKKLTRHTDLTIHFFAG